MKDKRTPNYKSLLFLRECGYEADISERRVGNVSKDLFGVFDGMALSGENIIFWQATSRSNIASRVRKVKDSAAWVRIKAMSGAEIWFFGWDDDRARILRYKLGELVESADDHLFEQAKKSEVQ